MTDRFRAVPPVNVPSNEAGAVDWSVYDSRTAKVGKQKFTRAFAEILASSMNWAYEEGRKSR
jgi:hypothetical protein